MQTPKPVKHVAAQENVRFALTDCRANVHCRQVVNLKLDQEDRQLNHFARKPLEQHATVFDQSEPPHNLAGQNGSIGGAIEVGGKIRKLCARRAAPQRHKYKSAGGST